jgi:hypothetical protein
MIYVPGAKAEAEYQAFMKRGGPVVLEVEPVKPEPEPAGLVKALVDRGVTTSTACVLVRDYPATRIKAQIEQMDETRRKIQDKTAYLVSAIREDFTTKAIAPRRRPSRRPRRPRRPTNVRPRPGTGPSSSGCGSSGRG